MNNTIRLFHINWIKFKFSQEKYKTCPRFRAKCLELLYYEYKNTKKGADINICTFFCG